MTANCFPRLLFEYLCKSGINFSYSNDHLHFNLNHHYVSAHKLTAKTWGVCYFFHTYRFNSQAELIEWIELQRKTND